MATIVCTLPNGDKREIELLNTSDPQHCFDMQDRGYVFQSKITIHKAPPTGCASCEA